jgi:hypothetical protein
MRLALTGAPRRFRSRWSGGHHLIAGIVLGRWLILVKEATQGRAVLASPPAGRGASDQLLRASVRRCSPGD